MGAKGIPYTATLIEAVCGNWYAHSLTTTQCAIRMTNSLFQVPIQQHFHPAVERFTSALLDKTQKMTKPDMESHTLIKFLDKFVYRNAKASDARGASIMQPLKAAKDIGDIWLGGGRSSAFTTQVNSAAFWNKKADDVAAEDVFFHKYFQHVAKEPKESTKKARATGDEDADEDAEEDEIWKALVNAQPDIDEDASDAGFDDLDELDMASDDDSSPALSLDGDDDDEEEGEDDDGVEFNDFSDEEDGDEEDGLVAPDVAESDEEKGDKRRARKKMIKGLPTFASVDDYAELLAGEEDDL